MSTIDDFPYQAFSERLLDWYGRHGRHDLPWQGRNNPYRTWVSEIMLQQTQVATVIPYFERFMTRFPDLESLANADMDEVLEHWTGLGYYARGRNLHKTAQRLYQDFSGEFPRDPDQLAELPGIGRSTAAAILAQSFDERHAILDGNVKRVLARVHRVEGWPGKTAVLNTLWSLSEKHTPDRSAAAYTQAIMDLGATICARKSLCALCPVSESCQAFIHGDVDRYPGKKPRKTLPQKESHMLLARDGQGRIYLERRPPNGIWGGLWSPPQFDAPEAMAAFLDRRFPRHRVPGDVIPSMSHTFSHFKLEIRPVLIEVEPSADAVNEPEDVHWLVEDDWPGGTASPIAKIIRKLPLHPA